MTNEPRPEELLQELCRRDTRYPFEAYEFVFQALGYVQHEMKQKGMPKEGPNHVTGQQLSEACREFALQEYGMMAGTVLRSWNIKKTDDIGELVYNLININLMTKTDTDRQEDFNNVYDMKKVFASEFSFAFEG
jgi:uncharacterized repeat protein (TIGR04138 family)